MASFQQALEYVLSNEGGYGNDPNDHGGPTKCGITQQDLARWRGHPVSADDVKNLEQDEIGKIYLAWYWQPLACDKIVHQGLATAVFDVSLPSGIVRSAKFIQAAAGVPVDGHIGAETVSAINAADARALLATFIPFVQNRYIDIAIKDETQIKFLHGWLNRSQKLIALMI